MYVFKTKADRGFVNLTVPVPAATWADKHALADYLAMITRNITDGKCEICGRKMLSTGITCGRRQCISASWKRRNSKQEGQ